MLRAFRSSHSTGFWVLFATISASSMAFVASTSLTVALPEIQRELSARGADLIWIPNAYVLVQASLIVASGSLGDHYGRSRVCEIGILLFALASLICGLSTSTGSLIAGRFAQGVGSALIIPNSLAIVSAYFSQRRQALAIGIWTGFTILASGLAPIVGGALTDLGVWRMVFLIHIPLGGVAAAILMRRVPESFNHEAPDRMSLAGTLLVSLGLGGITFGFIESSTYGFTSPLVIGSILGGILALAIFLRDEYLGKHQILPLWLFRSRTFSAANAITVVLNGVLGPVILYLPLNMIQIQGYSATLTGIALLPMTMLMIIISAKIGLVVDSRGPRWPLVFGLGISALGFIVFAGIGATDGPEAYFTTFFVPIVLFGLGFGASFAPLTVAALASAPEQNAGIASGVNSTMSRAGQVILVGVLGGLAISWFAQLIADDPAVRALPDDARAQLLEDAGDLAETAIPQSLSAAQAEAVRQAIRESFAATFSILMWIGAAFCLICSAIAYIFIDDGIVKRKVDGEMVPSPG